MNNTTELNSKIAGLESHVDVLIDGGYCGLEPTTVVDMTGPLPEITRQGMGDFSA